MRIFTSLDKRRWGTALITLVLAFSSGYITQYVLAEGNTAVAVSQPSVEPGPLPYAPVATLRTQLARPPVLTGRVSQFASRPDTQGCQPQLSVEPAPAATLRVDLSAPCHGLARVHVTQGDVTASMATDKTGRLSVRIPAFSTEPEVEIAIAGMTIFATSEVPEADLFDHVALQWSGAQALRINAYEFGAQKSQFGHVWSGAPKSPARATRGSGGFLTRLGDGLGNSAEIYSFPAGQSSHRGVIRLVAEATVTRENCGRRVKATALQSSAISTLRPTEVAVTLPGCDAIGQTVRLQNLFQDMRLAER